jgi:hypothetical protein
LDDQGLSLPFPAVKGLMAPTPISPLAENYIPLLIVVKLFLGLEYIRDSRRICSEMGFLKVGACSILGRIDSVEGNDLIKMIDKSLIFNIIIF